MGRCQAPNGSRAKTYGFLGALHGHKRASYNLVIPTITHSAKQAKLTKLSGITCLSGKKKPFKQLLSQGPFKHG